MRYLIRLDDACEKMDVEKWNRMENILDTFQVRPMVGIIPACRDPQMDVYAVHPGFWKNVTRWQQKGWSLGLHGCYHVYTTQLGGMNPVNPRSEFAGVPVEEQQNMIKIGVDVLHSHGIDPLFFFAPSHTFDKNTLEAIRMKSNIRIISDTIASDVYRDDDFYFIPQQSGRCRKLPVRLATFCFHPNTMARSDFAALQEFLRVNKQTAVSLDDVLESMSYCHGMSLYDHMLRTGYFGMKQIRRLLR